MSQYHAIRIDSSVQLANTYALCGGLSLNRQRCQLGERREVAVQDSWLVSQHANDAGLCVFVQRHFLGRNHLHSWPLATPWSREAVGTTVRSTMAGSSSNIGGYLRGKTKLQPSHHHHRPDAALGVLMLLRQLVSQIAPCGLLLRLAVFHSELSQIG